MFKNFRLSIGAAFNDDLFFRGALMAAALALTAALALIAALLVDCCFGFDCCFGYWLLPCLCEERCA